MEKTERWERDQGEWAVEINSARNAKLIKKKTFTQTKFIWVIRSDKERGRDSTALPKLLPDWSRVVEAEITVQKKKEKK